MSGAKVFLSCNSANAAAVSLAEKLKGIIGNSVFCGDFADKKDRESALTAADYLICIFDSESDFDARDSQTDWKFYLNEIAWKRKTGTVILYTPEDIDFKRLSYRLKDCAYFTFKETGEMLEYISSSPQEEENVVETEAVESVKQIVYTPRPAAVKQIEFSVRAPEVPSFDGNKKRPERERSGCTTDHVFKDKRGELNETDSVPEKSNGVKNSNSGCAAVGLGVFLMFLSAAILLAIFFL